MEKISRRNMLMLSLVASVGLMPGLGGEGIAEAATKLAKSRVQFQDKPNGGHKCGGCRFFQPPHSCQKVRGKIDPDDWCELWTPKG